MTWDETFTRKKQFHIIQNGHMTLKPVKLPILSDEMLWEIPIMLTQSLAPDKHMPIKNHATSLSD
jgi:hypothetical protein